MRKDLPTSVKKTAHDLSPDAMVTLFEIKLKGGATFRLNPHKEVVWRGKKFEDIPCHMTGVGQNTDAKVNRPRFSFANPGGIFTASLYNGQMDGATVKRIRILKADLDANLDFAIRETFRFSRIVQLGQGICVIELRDVLDGHNFKLPARAYFPPEFPHVKLR